MLAQCLLDGAHRLKPTGVLKARLSLILELPSRDFESCLILPIKKSPVKGEFFMASKGEMERDIAGAMLARWPSSPKGDRRS